MVRSAEEIALEKLRTRLTRRFHKACADYGLLADGDHVLVGLSGGKDSLALVELLGQRAQIYVPRFKVTALHVRVKERAYISDTGYLESFCAAVKVPLIVRDITIPDVPYSGENAVVEKAKKEKLSEENSPCFLCSWYRRKELFNVAQELGCNKIAFGHHRDDIVETSLMNLIFQGAFATMPPLLKMEKMPLEIIRPLCLIDEADLVRYATLSSYAKQKQLCPFEHVSSRAAIKEIMGQLRALNPELNDSVYAALTNIKTDYLPKK